MTANQQSELDMSERRRYPRADLVFRVRYRSIDPAVAPSLSEPDLQGAVGRDISLGGVSFRVSEDTVIGDTVHMAFYFDELPGEISAIGSVIRIWPEPGEKIVAVRFSVIDPDDCSILSTYIEEFESNHT